MCADEPSPFTVCPPPTCWLTGKCPSKKEGPGKICACRTSWRKPCYAASCFQICPLLYALDPTYFRV